jgi:hypothetical protein
METSTHANIDDVLRRYLLGRLGPGEIEGIENRLFSDDRIFWERLCLAEEELADDCAWGRLAAEEKEAFDRHFLCSDERRAKLEFARALKASLEERQPGRRGAWRWLVGPVHVPGWALVAAAALLLAVIPAAAWRLAVPGAPSGTVTAWLASGQIRDVSQGMTRVVAGPGCQLVRLPLETVAGGRTSFAATLFDVTENEIEVLAQRNLVARPVDGKLAVTLTLPCELLREGDYYVNLQDESPGRAPASVGRYNFRVLRQ